MEGLSTLLAENGGGEIHPIICRAGHVPTFSSGKKFVNGLSNH